MGGSICPPEVLRDCNKKMGVKTVMVSALICFFYIALIFVNIEYKLKDWIWND
jgi:hypothetical protein